MRALHQLAALWRALVRNARVDADLAEEMRFHLERETQANVARGMSPESAHRAARLKFGSVDDAHEASRDDRPGVGIRQTLNDLRFGARLLAKSPMFGITAIAIVALGVGAATAIFSVVYGVMLRPLPFHEPERLVSIWLSRGQAPHMYPSAADAAELRQLRGVFTDVALVRSSNANLSLVGDGEPQRLQAARVSPNLFRILGVSPALGREIATDEDKPGHERVVMLSDALWRSRYGADRAVIGRQIRLDGGMYTVVGVMPADFQYPTTGLDAWIPAVLDPGELTRATINNYRLVARLDRRTTLEQARRETAALANRLGKAYHPLTWSGGAGFTVDSMLDDAVGAVRPALRLLLGRGVVPVAHRVRESLEPFRRSSNGAQRRVRRTTCTRRIASAPDGASSRRGGAGPRDRGIAGRGRRALGSRSVRGRCAGWPASRREHCVERRQSSRTH